MRKAALLTLLVLLLAAPALALEAAQTNRLSVSDGRGVVALKGKGVVIARLDRGSVSVTDLTPADETEPLVFGCEEERFRGQATVCSGENLRFRLIGGSWRVVIRGAGLDLSAVLRGSVFLDGDSRDPGVYSTSGVDCRTDAAECDLIPDVPVTIQLGPSPR